MFATVPVRANGLYNITQYDLGQWRSAIFMVGFSNICHEQESGHEGRELWRYCRACEIAGAHGI